MINYQIKRSDGSTYATIPNNVILGPNQPGSNPVPLNFVGRNKVGYGQAWNENFLHLVENFSSSNRPKGNIKGQLWYKNSNNTGELLISLIDDAQQPLDASTEAQWAAIPMITLFNTLPDGTNSVMGRMVLTNNGDSLRVLMKNKEWREIQTKRPESKEYSNLLDINYDLGTQYIQFTQDTSTKPVTYFNLGGVATVDANGWTTFDSGNGVYQFGGNYFYELRIIFREVQIINGILRPVPSNYKNWTINGQFYVDNKGQFVPGQVQCKDLPDPRKIASISSITDTINSTKDTWDVSVVMNGIDPSLPNPTGLTKADYEAWVINSLNSNKHLGLRIDGSISGLGIGENVKLQCSVNLKLTGIPPSGV